MGQEDETSSATSTQGETRATSGDYEKGVQETENQNACKTNSTKDLCVVHSKKDSPEPILKRTVWKTLRTDVKKVFSDLSTQLLRPASSDVMHMRPLIREDQGTIYFGKTDQETSNPLKPTVTRKTAIVVPLQHPETLPMNKYFDNSQNQKTASTPDVQSTEDTNNTTKSVCILLLCTVSNYCFNS